MGELLADLITEENFAEAEHFLLKLGGSPGNIAKFLSQLGKRTRMLTRVGNDPIGKRLVSGLSERGVDVSYVQFDSQLGTTLVFVQRTTLTPDFFVLRGADGFLKAPDASVLDGVSIVHFSCWPFTVEPVRSVAVSLLKMAGEKGIRIAFDPNCRDKLFPCGKIERELIESLLSHIDYCKPSLDDAEALFGPPPGFEELELESKVRFYLNEFHRRGVKNIVLTAGPEGAFAYDGQRVVHVPPAAELVVDATGAGDGFWAGLYYGLLEGMDFFRACTVGSFVAAQVLAQVGADVQLDIAQLRERLESVLGTGNR